MPTTRSYDVASSRHARSSDVAGADDDAFGGCKKEQSIDRSRAQRGIRHFFAPSSDSRSNRPHSTTRTPETRNRRATADADSTPRRRVDRHRARRSRRSRAGDVRKPCTTRDAPTRARGSLPRERARRRGDSTKGETLRAPDVASAHRRRAGGDVQGVRGDDRARAVRGR